VNGSYDNRPGLYAFKNANIVMSAQESLSNAVLLVKDKKIEAIGPNLNIPEGYVVIDLQGKFIYPSFVDAFSSYGVVPASRQSAPSGYGRSQIFTSTKKGP